ncbi:hypothetical protein GGS21DRAFT_392072 [Xylaria nigripes]|nr:hypothetical protein GGS21DRAFT_392072 [Xylaria nigripes]
MIYCAYCGKGFSRKEHLERHLPSHTNVKPYHCSDCHLGFSRRDLLQRHHLTYHVAKDPMTCPSGSMTTPEKKSRIACASCALAKTGCDKQTPSCTRCRDKGITCVPRHARRTARLTAIRKQRAGPNLSAQTQLAPQVQSTSSTQSTPVMAFDTMVSVDRGSSHHTSHIGSITSPPQQFMTTNTGNSPSVKSPHSSTDFYPSPQSGAESLSHSSTTTSSGIFPDSGSSIYQFQNDMLQQEPIYMWPPPNTYDLDFELLPPSLCVTQANHPAPILTHTRNMSNSDQSISDWSSSSISDQMISSPAQPDPDSAFPISEDSAAPFAWQQVLYPAACPRTTSLHLDALDQNNSTTLEILQQYMLQTEPGWDDDTGLPSV